MQYNATMKSGGWASLSAFPDTKHVVNLLSQTSQAVITPLWHPLQVLPDVSAWEYKGQDEVRNQHCNLWELRQR